MFSLLDIEKYALIGEKFTPNNQDIEKCEISFNFLKEYSKDKIIYGINTGFGPMAQYKVSEKDLNQLQYNLIRSHTTGLGEHLESVYAKSVVFSRITNFLQGKSGVSVGVINQLIDYLNHNIIPEIPEHGGVGASGDLVQLAHLATNLIGEGSVTYNGKKVKTNEILKKLNLKPLDIKLRDGLGIINGTSCMTGIGAINLIYSERLLNWSIACSSIINDIVASFDDSFSAPLNNAKLHKGQQKVASQMRGFLAGSKQIQNRYEYFAEDKEFQKDHFEKKMQEYYSIRCIPQILGPIYDTIEYSKQVIENELNSTNDNPIVDSEEGHVYHGGNFHGDYVALEMDKLKIAITKMSILLERQLNFLLNSKLNEIFPPFLNAEKLGFNFGFQGMQFTATSTTAENQMLSNPMSIHSISNNNDNQDVVSMGTNAAITTKKVIDNTFQVLSIHILAVCQAIDLLKEEERNKLSKNTLKVFNSIRATTKMVRSDESHSDKINNTIELLKNTKLAL